MKIILNHIEKEFSNYTDIIMNMINNNKLCIIGIIVVQENIKMVI